MFMKKNKFRTHVNMAFNINNGLLKITSADRMTGRNKSDD